MIKGVKQTIRAPRRAALLIACSYLAITTIWVQVSQAWVLRLAGGNTERLVQLQIYKALGFMTFSTIGLYFALMAVAKKAALASRTLSETQGRWAAAERRAAPALVASVIAHDVANLLTVLRLNVEKLKRSNGVAERETLTRLDNGVDRLTELVKRLKGASSTLFQQPPALFDFSKAVGETLSLMQSHSCCESTTIQLIESPRVMLRGYPVLVHQLVMNLLINAAEATGRVGVIRFQVMQIPGGVALAVDDNGPGIAASLREKVLGAFFTTKETGTGLGLCSVRSCVDMHGGTLEIGDSTDLGGARFTMTLPDLTDHRFIELKNPAERPLDL